MRLVCSSFINVCCEYLGFQQGDTWILEKVLVDTIAPDVHERLLKEESEIEAGTFKRNPHQDENDEDPRSYFSSETITLVDIQPENKVVDLDADQVQIVENETKPKLEQFEREEQNKQDEEERKKRTV